MAKMKVVAPKMTAIREKYKSDPAKMNQATMELYKKEKINPLGGCLPILIQMPVFISLYYVLQAAVEVRARRCLSMHWRSSYLASSLPEAMISAPLPQAWRAGLT